MGTELTRFRDAYATMLVASYEPLILRWVSGYQILQAANLMTLRLRKPQEDGGDSAISTAHLVSMRDHRGRLPAQGFENVALGEAPLPEYPTVDSAGRSIDKAQIKKPDIGDGRFLDPAAVNDKVLYPLGVLRARRTEGVEGVIKGDAAMGVDTFPTVFNRSQQSFVDPELDVAEARANVTSKMIDAAKAWVEEDSSETLAEKLRASVADIDGRTTYDFMPALNLQEALSPIGIAHFYRQLYFNLSEGVGPIEEAFTIAPLETLEVVYESTRRQIHEEQVEIGTEVVSEKAVEEKNLDEVSDKVSSMVQRDNSASFSASGGVNFPVWSASASASGSMSVSSQQAREETSRRLREVTTRASERISRSFTIKTRDMEELTLRNLTRRVIRNEADHPVSYGLRRVLRRVRVKVQDLGPRLVWQLYIRNPGTGLARSRFVHFREAQPISVPDMPPGLRPRPVGGTATGSTQAAIGFSNSPYSFYVTVKIQTAADRKVTGVSIDSITDLEGGGKDDAAPAPNNARQWGKTWDLATNTYTVNIAVKPGDSSAVSINYTYTWEPSDKVLAEWEAERKTAQDKFTEDARNQQFEREKTLITEKSKIRPRPANDLRREERYEIMSRMVAHFTARGEGAPDPTPLEIEYFHRYFDIDGTFVYNHPSWWRPRYTPVATAFDRPAYEITNESEPAPMGSSLGWMIQLDGDTRRSEFLNSPWARVCMPINPGREREAIAWLAQHIEGEIGYDPEQEPLSTLLSEIEQLRDRQNKLGVQGPDYVRVDSTVGAPADPQRPEGIYPIVSEFEVSLPTDGFVYDALTILDA